MPTLNDPNRRPFQNIVQKGENAGNHNVFTCPKTSFNFWCTAMRKKVNFEVIFVQNMDHRIHHRLPTFKLSDILPQDGIVDVHDPLLSHVRVF